MRWHCHPSVKTTESLLQRLHEIGVECKDDLTLIKIEDLEGILRPIQGRKLLQAFIAGPSAAVESPCRAGLCRSHEMETSGTCVGDEFQIPWHKMPPALIQALTDQKRPTPLLRKKMKTETASSIVKGDLPSTLCIVALGETVLTAGHFMVAVDQIIVNDHLHSPLTALSFFFATYYVLNIQYPHTATLALEFIQRCLVGINPERGSKKEQKRGKKSYNTHPRILRLLSDLRDFETPWKL
ncbi:uncharacterized protein LOC144732018 [Lampetra planeri]